jgi:colicin import membrane protein
VNPFLREHAGPLLGSATLHVALAAAVVAAAVWTVTPRVSPPAAIEAYVAKLPAPRVAAPPTPAPTAAAERERDEAADRARRDEELRLERARAEAVELKAKVEAERRAAEEQMAVREAQRREQAVAARQAEAAQRKAEADAQRRAAAEAAQRASREADLTRQLAAEEHRLGAENAGLLARYVSEIQARIERAWNRPPSARAGLKCTVFVSQVPGGTVTNVRLGECNGDAAVQQSVTLAVFRASPLPAPPDPSLFERNLRLVFTPDD